MTASVPMMPLFLPSVGPMELGLIFIVVLILFGPGKLPDVFKALGSGVKQFKDAANGTTPETTATKTPPSDSAPQN